MMLGIWPIDLMQKTSTTIKDLIDIKDLVDINFQSIDITYPGNRAVERDVYSNIASPGTQLGIVADAVLELARATGNDDRKDLKDFQRLKELAKEVKENKEKIFEAQVRQSLKLMKSADPNNFQAALKAIVDDMETATEEKE